MDNVQCGELEKEPTRKVSGPNGTVVTQIVSG